MYKYKVTPNNKTDYIVYAEYVETDEEWLLFFKLGIYPNAPILVHACSSHYTRYVNLSE